MKSFLTFLAFFISAQYAFANPNTELVAGDLSLSSAQPRILKVELVCPKRPGEVSCRAYGSRVTVEVRMKGCMDRLGGYFSSFSSQNGMGQLSFGAVNVHNELSLRVFCVDMPKEIITVTVPFEGKIELAPLKLTGL